MKRTVNLREMSAVSPQPILNQDAQTRKVMMELQQEKKRLKMLQPGRLCLNTSMADYFC